MRPRTRLRLEALDDRSVPSAGALDPTFGSGGTVFKDYGVIDPNAASAGVRALFTYPASDAVNAGKVLGAGYVSTPNVTHTGSDFAVMRYNADGTPDATFGTNGITITDFNTKPNDSFGSNDYVFCLAVDGGGRIVVGSTEHLVMTSSTSGVQVPDFALARYTPAGQLDTDPVTGFGPANAATGLRPGKFTTTFPGGTATTNGSTARAVAVQPDGKLVVAGQAYSAAGSQDFALARYNDDGSLDPSFGSNGNGLVTTPILAGADYARAMVLQADGRIVLAGSASNGSDLDFAAARYNPNGTLDATFGTNGKVTTAITVKAPTPKKRNAPAPPAADDEAVGLVQDAAGQFTLAGYTVNTSTGQKDTALVRYTPGGALDTSFSSGGKVVTDLGGNDIGRALVLQPDGKLVVAGSVTTATTGEDFALARYNPNGALDGTFGTNGKVTTAITTSGDSVMALTLQPDGRIVAGGYAGRGFAVARYLGDPPTAPANVAAAAVAPSQVNLTWTETTPGVTGYYVERSIDGVSFALVATVDGTATGYSDTGLTPGATYYYRIRAYSPNGPSAYSSVAGTITPVQ